MTYEQFTYWLRGYLASQTDSQMKIDIERAIKDIDETSSPSSIRVNPWTNPYPLTPGTGDYWYSTPNGTTTTKKEVLND